MNTDTQKLNPRVLLMPLFLLYLVLLGCLTSLAFICFPLSLLISFQLHSFSLALGFRPLGSAPSAPIIISAFFSFVCLPDFNSSGCSYRYWGHLQLFTIKARKLYAVVSFPLSDYASLRKPDWDGFGSQNWSCSLVTASWTEVMTFGFSWEGNLKAVSLTVTPHQIHVWLPLNPKNWWAQCGPTRSQDQIN